MTFKVLGSLQRDKVINLAKILKVNRSNYIIYVHNSYMHVDKYTCTQHMHTYKVNYTDTCIKWDALCIHLKYASNVLNRRDRPENL